MKSTLAGIACVGWSWHHGRFDGQTLAVVIVLLLAAAVAALRDIDSQRPRRIDDVDRFADPTPLHTDRRPGC